MSCCRRAGTAWTVYLISIEAALTRHQNSAENLGAIYVLVVLDWQQRLFVQTFSVSGQRPASGAA